MVKDNGRHRRYWADPHKGNRRVIDRPGCGATHDEPGPRTVKPVPPIRVGSRRVGPSGVGGRRITPRTHGPSWRRPRDTSSKPDLLHWHRWQHPRSTSRLLGRGGQRLAQAGDHRIAFGRGAGDSRFRTYANLSKGPPLRRVDGKPVVAPVPTPNAEPETGRAAALKPSRRRRGRLSHLHRGQIRPREGRPR